jgi:N-acetylglucosaminyl-diphospho-decaprenol L-rhamnosyltransferase
MRFTALVVTFNSAHELPGLIESVERHLAGRCELLFVDNASDDGTVRVIRELSPESRVIELDHNVGFGPANNIAVRQASTEVVALLNPDTVALDGSLADLAELASHERALFAPRLLNEDRTPQISAGPPLASWESMLIAVWPGSLMPRWLHKRCEPWRYEERLPAGYVTGACLVAQRDLLIEFGPFDERLIMYGEDGDLSLRAWQQGVPSISAADVARIVHLGGRSAAHAFSDLGTQRRIQARWWVAHERLGPWRGAFDLATQFLRYGTRWLVGRLLRRETAFESTWLRAAPRAVRSGRPGLPSPLATRRAPRLAGRSQLRSRAVSEPKTVPDRSTTIAVPPSRRLAQMNRPRWLRNAWFATRQLTGARAGTLPLLRFAPAPYMRVMVQKDMDACIDGMPRSANTFGGWAFLEQNPDASLAHHQCLPGQVLRAVRLGVPCAVLIREPLANLTSLVIAAENDLSHKLAFRAWIDYYRRVATVRDRVALCTFEEVLDDPAVIARRINAAYGTEFNCQPMDEAQKRDIVERLEQHHAEMRIRPGHGTVPNNHKENLKPGVRKALSQHRLLPAADALYAELTADAARPLARTA